MTRRKAFTLIGIGMLAAKIMQRRRIENLAGQVVLITGGSRGLGLQLAHEFAREGCLLAICARDEQELERARLELTGVGAKVVALPCDVSNREQVERLVQEVLRLYGRIDILVNNAGIIQVGPLQSMTIADFEQAMGVMYWGILYTTLAVLPQMKSRRHGHIVNITSIGGKVSVPHLLPYTSAKFAAVGLSEGLRAELADDGIRVTTISPGLMRTGSYQNAMFKGEQAGEYTWFSLGSSLPFISMDAQRAARQIVQATRYNRATRTLSVPALLLDRFHGLFPGLTADILGLVDYLILPKMAGNGRTTLQPGIAVQSQLSPTRNGLLRLLTPWGRAAV